MFISFGCFGLYSNLVSSYCSTTNLCSSSSFNSMSVINKFNKLDALNAQNYGLIGFVAIISLFFFYIRYEFEFTKSKCDDKVETPSDYALILKRLPPSLTLEKIEEVIYSKRDDLTDE